jgi:hypothetical protein
MHSIKRNAAAEARGVPETDQLGGTVNPENSLTTEPVQGHRGGQRARAKGDRIEREIVSRQLGEYDCLFLRRDSTEPMVLLPWRAWTVLVATVRR